MKAKEMFEELGYKQVLSEDYIKYVSFFSRIAFDLTEEGIVIDCSFAIVGAITMDDLKAINKQCEELGWFVEEKNNEVKQSN